MGLEEYVEGTLLQWAEENDFVGLCVEGGQHHAKETEVYLEGALWLALEHIGFCTLEDETRALWRERLAQATPRMPDVVEVLYRHAVQKGDRFRMQPGFQSFDPIRKGQTLAYAQDKPIFARHHGCILLPLYQAQGEDGFFEGQAVARAWFRVSEVLRKSGLDAGLGLLPGIRRDPDRPDVYWADLRVARLRTNDVFHLLGYEKIDEIDGWRAFRKRKEREV